MRRRRRRVTTIVLASGAAAGLLALALILAAPAVSRGASASDVGTAVTALLSAIAASVVAAALVVQIRQFKTSQAQGIRMMQIDLMRMLLDDPGLWPRSPAFPGVPNDQRRRAIFTNLMFRYLELGIEVNYLRPESVRMDLGEILRIPEIRQFWATARPKYAAGVGSDAQREFLDLVESAYDEAAPAKASREAGRETATVGPRRRRQGRRRAPIALGLAIAVGVAIGRRLRRSRRRVASRSIRHTSPRR